MEREQALRHGRVDPGYWWLDTHMDGHRADHIANHERGRRLFRDGRLLDAAQLAQPPVPAGVRQAQGLAITGDSLRRRVLPPPDAVRYLPAGDPGDVGIRLAEEGDDNLRRSRSRGA